MLMNSWLGLFPLMCSMSHEIYWLSRSIFAERVLIPTKQETESAHNKNFIMALTIDLHRPLLALEYRLLRLLERSPYNIRGSFELSLFTSMWRDSLFIKESKTNDQMKLFEIKKILAYDIQTKYKSKYLIFQIQWKKIFLNFTTDYT